MGKKFEKNRNENNIIDVSPSRFSILAEVEGEKSEEKIEQDSTTEVAEVEEGEIECKQVSNKADEGKGEQLRVRPSLPRGSKLVIKNVSESSFQVSKDKIS